MWSSAEVKEVLDVAGVEEVSQLSGALIAPFEISETFDTPATSAMLYLPIQLEFREVYSAPGDDEEEWIVLYNPTEQAIDITGYILDDIRDGGSKPHVLNEIIIEPLSEYYLPSPVILNNGGDTLWLLTPDELHSIMLEIPRMKRGEAYALRHDDWCTTSTPTPYAENVCVKVLSASHSSTISVPKPLPERWLSYENIAVSQVEPQLTRAAWTDALLTANLASNDIECKTSIWSEIVQLIFITLFVGGGMWWWIRKK
jgi:hypothetical protein